MRTEDELDTIMANLDFSQAKPVSQVPALAKIQAQRKLAIQQSQEDRPIDAIEDDVWFLIKQKIHNTQEITRMNGVLRSLLT